MIKKFNIKWQEIDVNPSTHLMKSFHCIWQWGRAITLNGWIISMMGNSLTWLFTNKWWKKTANFMTFSKRMLIQAVIVTISLARQIGTKSNHHWYPINSLRWLDQTMREEISIKESNHNFLTMVNLIRSIQDHKTGLMIQITDVVTLYKISI